MPHRTRTGKRHLNTCFPGLLLDHQIPTLISWTQCQTREKGKDKMMEVTCGHQGCACMCAFCRIRKLRCSDSSRDPLRGEWKQSTAFPRRCQGVCPMTSLEAAETYRWQTTVYPLDCITRRQATLHLLADTEFGRQSSNLTLVAPSRMSFTLVSPPLPRLCTQSVTPRLITDLLSYSRDFNPLVLVFSTKRTVYTSLNTVEGVCHLFSNIIAGKKACWFLKVPAPLC